MKAAIIFGLSLLLFAGCIDEQEEQVEQLNIGELDYLTSCEPIDHPIDYTLYSPKGVTVTIRSNCTYTSCELPHYLNSEQGIRDTYIYAYYREELIYDATFPLPPTNQDRNNLSWICELSKRNISAVNPVLEEAMLENQSYYYIVNRLMPLLRSEGTGVIEGVRQYSETKVYGGGGFLYYDSVYSGSDTVKYPISDIVRFSFTSLLETPTQVVNETQFKELRERYDVRVVRCAREADGTYEGDPYVLMCLFQVEDMNFLSEITSIEEVSEYPLKELEFTIGYRSLCKGEARILRKGVC